jgi:hypothetical protein
MPEIESAERPGVGLDGAPRPTEDRIVVLPNAVLLLDGATSPVPVERDGGWYSAVLAEALTAVVTARPHDDLADLLAEAVADLVDRYGLVPGDSPSSTVAMLRWGGETVDALVLADSPVVAFGQAGVDVVADTRLAELRGTVPRVTDWRNREGGFWVAEALPAAAHRAVVRSWPRAEVDAVLMTTDGVSCGVDDYDLFTWRELLDLAERSGPESVLDAVREAELSDPDRTRWHRHKVHDDQALALVRF